MRREEEEGQADPWEDAGEDEIIQAFFDEMERIRPDIAGVAPASVDQPDFRYRPRADGINLQGQVLRHGAASEWCKRRGLQQTMKFNMQTLGLDEANILGNAWAVRMQFLFDADTQGLLEPADRMERTLATMVWPPDFVRLQAEGTDEAKARAADIMQITVL